MDPGRLGDGFGETGRQGRWGDQSGDGRDRGERWGDGRQGEGEKGLSLIVIDLSGFIQVLGKLVCVQELEGAGGLEGTVTSIHRLNFAHPRVQRALLLCAAGVVVPRLLSCVAFVEEGGAPARCRLQRLPILRFRESY